MIDKGVKRNNRFHIKVVLILIAFSCLPIIVLWLIQKMLAESQLKEQMYNQSGTVLTYFNEQLDDLVMLHSQSLQQLCEDTDIINFMTDYDNNIYKVNYKLQLIFGNEKSMQSVYVIPAGNLDATGTAHIPENYRYPFNEQNLGLFRKVRASKDMVIHLNERRINASPDVIFSLAGAVYDGEAILGYVIIDINREAVSRLILETGMDIGSDIYLYDNWRFVCFTTVGSSAEGREKLPEYIPERNFTTLETGQSPYGNLGLIRQTNKMTGLTMVMEVPLFHTDTSMYAIEVSAKWTLAVCFMLSVGAALMAGNSITNPLLVIMKQITKVKSGDFTAKIEHHRRDEFGVLMDSFNDMTGQISHYIEMVEEKQKNLRIAEMKNLQAQIQPHFLYNTLDLIKWNIKLKDNDKAASMITNLGKLLRTLMSTQDLSTVSEELDLVRCYLEIQAIHYNENLTVEWGIEEDIKDYTIPKLILQPIVENSVIHGLSPARSDNRISIRARKEHEYLIFTIQDNGVGIEPRHLKNVIKSGGTDVSIGLANVDTRLKLFGDDNCGIQIDSSEDGTAVKLICKRIVENA